MYHARRLIQPYFTEGSELAIESPLEDNVSHLSMEKWYDSLGYCESSAAALGCVI